MSLSNILERIQRKGEIPTASAQPKTLGGRNGPLSSQSTRSAPLPASSSRTSQRDKPIDPVVARLKAARKLEVEQKAKEKLLKNPQLAKSSSSRTSAGKPKATIPLRQPAAGAKGKSNAKPTKNGSSKAGGAVSAPPSRPPAKKMKFNELMKKASMIDKSKLSISIKPSNNSAKAQAGQPRVGSLSDRSSAERSASPSLRRTPPSGAGSRVSATPSSSSSYVKKSRFSGPRPQSNAVSGATKASQSAAVAGPIPMRKPSQKLERNLSERKQLQQEPNEYDDDSDVGSFIASSDEEVEQEEEMADAGYNRDEIWAIFNRGKKRSAYYDNDDYDSDDMEATGAEVLEEERRSKARAEAEDRREWEEEQRRIAVKRLKKQGAR